ncbi:MAG TPA: bi-domain-containing oxidoreductase [Terriglobales bacterium]|jgi:predicted dehydrogenase/threonine dehydrogenase-like Zn-dependent dehydrogenase|nr:bi-domain-containing oxidoreductase [Terriglobales bacterium]
MKQVLQQVRGGDIEVAEVVPPKLLPGCVLVRTAASLVSVGTERASSEFARKNLLQKARMRPDLVREVWNKVRRDGVASTVAAVRSRMDQPSAPGYSSAGTVVAAGEGVTDIQPGDRVACAGAGHAVHAEIACIPRLLLARIPSDSAVSLEHAAATTVGAVALHGVRTAAVQLGDIVGVIGLGLLGQLTVQILKAASCRVVGMDIDPGRADLALRLGADAASVSATAFSDECMQVSGGRGADAVLITAQTPSSDPINLAAEVARDRAVITAVGTVGMSLERRIFYEKELDFRISRSYGPGRYDAAYEQKGIDYPIGYVRWTETRNMEAFLRLLADGKVDVGALITHRFPIDEAQSAYELISGTSREKFLGVLITYPESAGETERIVPETVKSSAPAAATKSVAIGLLGAGSFATGTLLPAIKRVGDVTLVGVCAANGSHSQQAVKKFGFRYAAANEETIINDATINTIVIATRHNLHARQVVAAVKAGKHVFCEKPLCLNDDELREILRACDHWQDDRPSAGSPLLMVGFNRRFAPLALRLKTFLREIHEPLALHYRVNAGFIPADHWLNDPEQGGGRIIGEVCHFVDFLSFLTGSAPVEVEARSLSNPGKYSNDNVIGSLRFADGSQGTISYLANGDKSYSKERVEVFGGGAVAVLEDFRRLETVSQGRKQVFRSLLRQDKGHRGEWKAFVDAVSTGAGSPLSLASIVTSMLATFALEESRSIGRPVSVAESQRDR